MVTGSSCLYVVTFEVQFLPPSIQSCFPCRRKLDSIITKLHKVTPSEKESFKDEENQVKCFFYPRCCVNFVDFFFVIVCLHACVIAVCDNCLIEAGNLHIRHVFTCKLPLISRLTPLEETFDCCDVGLIALFHQIVNPV